MSTLTRQEIADKIKQNKKEQNQLDKTLKTLFELRRKLLGGTKKVSPGGGKSRRP